MPLIRYQQGLTKARFHDPAVDARMILMSASLQPWLKHASGARQALMLFLLTDANWLLGARYHSEGGRDLGISPLPSPAEA